MKSSTTRALRWVVVSLLAYAGMVTLFESMLGVFQPAGQSTLVITTMEADGTEQDRVVSRLESGGQLFVAANHWPRAWYRRALENPRVEVTIDGATRSYRAIPATDTEHERVDEEHGLGLVFRFMTGFPPRYFVRLEPR